MKVLVTGGAGYIGSHTVQSLIDTGHQVVVFDNLSTGFKSAIPMGVEFVQGDVCNQQRLSETMQTFEIEAVVHFAAKMTVPESIERPIEYYQNNTLGVLSLVQACLVSGIDKIVFSSTAAVYGEVKGCDLVSEDFPTAPLTPYGWSKLMSEQILRDCEKPYGLRSVCLRYFNVAGAAVDGKNGQRTKDATHLIKVVCEAACGKRKAVRVFGTDYPTQDGTGVRDFIHVEDLADLHVRALEYLSNGGKSDVFNCGYGRGFSVREVIETVCRISGNTIQVIDEPRRSGDAAQVVANSTKVKNAFNWQPKRNDLDLICRTAYEWEKHQA